MSVKSFPFDSLSMDNPDRAVDSSVMAAYMAAFFSNGIFATQYEMLATKRKEGLVVTIAPGVACINGRIYIQDAERTVTFERGGELGRIDRIVLRMDLNQQYRNIELYIKKGNEAVNPVAPELTRNNVVYEIALAAVRIPANATDILADQITDNRYDDDLCGMVYALLGNADVSMIVNQMQSYLDKFVVDTDAWLAEMKDLISSTDAGKLQVSIDELGNRVDEINTKLGDPLTTLEQVEASTNPAELVGAGVVRELNSNFVYKQDEQPTGEIWIDGKPIYRKIFTGEINNVRTSVNHNIVNIGDFRTIGINSYITNTTRTLCNAPNTPNISNPSAYTISVSNISTETFQIIVGDSGVVGGKYCIELRYTKTTD